MSAIDLQLRASEFVRRYPKSGLEQEAVAEAWAQHPEAACIETGVKAERIEQINKVLMRADIDPVKLVRLVGANPEAISRPAQQFLGQYGQMASALDELSLPPRAFMDMLVQQPQLASMPLAKMLFPISYLAQHMAECGLEPALLGKAIADNPKLLPLLCGVEEVGLMQLHNRIGNRHNFTDGKSSPKDKEIMRRELHLMLTHPESVIASYLPERGLVDVETVAPLGLVSQTEAVRQFLGAKAPSDAEIGRMLEKHPQQAILANLTADDITEHLRQVRQSFRKAGINSATFYLQRLLGSGYLPEKGADVAADLDKVFGDALELKKRMGCLHTASFVVKAAANAELRRHGIDQIIANQQGLTEYLQPYGISERTIQLTCARYHPLYTTSPEAARAHVREVVDYFYDPNFTEETYLKIVTSPRVLSLRVFATPPGQVTKIFDALSDILGIGKQKLLPMVKARPILTSHDLQFYNDRIDAMYRIAAAKGIERNHIVDLASADPIFFTRNTEQMGHDFVGFCDRMKGSGLSGLDLLIKARQRGFIHGTQLPQSVSEIMHAPRVEPQLRHDAPSISVLVRRQQEAQEKETSLATLATYLEPYGVTQKSLQLVAARHSPLFETTPEHVAAHVREVVDYFADPAFGEKDYLTLIVQANNRDLRLLATPPGQPSEFFDDLRREYGIEKRGILKEIKNHPSFVRRTLAECSERVDAMHKIIEPLGVSRNEVKALAADDLSFFSRDTVKLGQRFASLYDHMSQYGMSAADLMRCARMKSALLTVSPETLTGNVDPVFQRTASVGITHKQYCDVLKTRPELFFYKHDRVWDNFLLVREAYQDGTMQPSRQAKALGATPETWVLANSLALAFSTDMLALRRVWARETRGGKVDNYLKASIAQIQGELAEKLGPSTDFAALAQRELTELGERIGHKFAEPVDPSAKKSWGKRAPAAT